MKTVLERREWLSAEEIAQDVSQEWRVQVRQEKELSLSDDEWHQEGTWEPSKYEMNKADEEYIYTNWLCYSPNSEKKKSIRKKNGKEG